MGTKNAGVVAPRDCSLSVRQAIQQLSAKIVGLESTPTFASLTLTGTVILKEQTAADVDIAAYGQIWCKTATPNTLWFVNDVGTEVRIAPQDLQTSASPTFARQTLTDTCLVAGGANFLRVTGLQTDGTAMTGTLRGAYIDVSNGSTVATGTIRGMELKARTEAPGDSGSNVAVLEGLSISADSKDHSVTTMRAAEFILDGSTGGTITEAVGLRIANNLQANKATTSYGLQIYRDSFDYTADIDLTANPKISADGSILFSTEGVEGLFLGIGTTYGDAGEHNVFISYHAGYNNDTSGTISGYSERLGTRNIYIGARAGAGETLLTGTITVTQNSTAVTGNGTLFESELEIGDIIRIREAWGTIEVATITDDTNLILDSNFTGTTQSGVSLIIERGANKGAENIAIGHLSLTMNSEGYENTAAGDNALKMNTVGHGNSAFGNDALQGLNDTPITGNFNTGLGTDSLFSLSSGDYNAAVGYQTLYDITTESYNVAFGYQAGYNNTISYMVVIGYQAGRGNTGTFQTVGGYQAGYENTGDHQTTSGYRAGYQNTGDYQVALGYRAGLKNSAIRQSVFGADAGYENIGNYQTVGGYQAGYQNSGIDQSALGYRAGYKNSGPTQSVFGTNAGRENTGDNQSTFGFSAGYFNIGNNQSAFGYNAGKNNAGNNQFAFGRNAGFRNTGASQTALGSYAGQYNDGNNNTSVGYGAFNTFTEDGGSAVTFDFGDVDVANDRVTVTAHGLGANDAYLNLKFDEGTSSLPGIVDGINHQWKIIDVNTLEIITDTITGQGTGAGHTLTPQVVYSNSTALGYDAEPDASNQVMLGNTNVTMVKTAGGLTLDGNIIMSDGRTIGQAAGPLIAFDDTNNFLEITGCDVGVGTTSPACTLDINGGMRVIGTDVPATGAGIEYQYIDPIGYMFAYDRDASEYREFRFYADPIAFYDSADRLVATIVDNAMCIGTAAPVTKLTVEGIITLPKASGNGIKIDTTTPTFGWADLQAEPSGINTGATKPTQATYRDTLKQFQFAAGDEEYYEYHIPHDYVSGTDVHIHVHWSHIGTFVTGGTITFTVESSYAKGHNQAPFPASVSGDFNGTASTTQYQHIVSETQLSASSPAGLQIDTDDLEPDGIIIMRVLVKTNDMTVSEGGVPDPFIHHVDVHYQTTGLIGTKQKAPDFYT